VKSQTYGKHLKFLNPSSSFDIPKGTKNHIKHCYPQGVAIAKTGSTGDALPVMQTGNPYHSEASIASYIGVINTTLAGKSV